MRKIPERPDWDDRDEIRLPPLFIAIEENGGQFEGLSFTAGYQLGELTAGLQTRSVAAGTYLIFSSLQIQADLVAMQYGYSSEVLADDGEWTQIGFTRMER